MTVAQFKAWLAANGIPDDFGLIVVRFGRDECSLDEIEGIKVNSGGTSVQLEVYPDGWRPVSEGTTRVTPAGLTGPDMEATVTAKRYEMIWRNKWLRAEPSIGLPGPGGASTMREAAMLEAVAERIKGHPVDVDADTHYIGLEGPEDILRSLVEEGVLDPDELGVFEEGEQ
jgi:hypothetical protein